MEIMDLLQTKRTYRRFDQSRPVPRQVVDDMMEAARLASCAGNKQPLRYLAVCSEELVEQIFPFTYWAAALTDAVGRPRKDHHPVMYWAVLCDKDAKNFGLGVDAGLAMDNIITAAWYHGVGSCMMGNINRDEIRRILSVDPSLEILYMIAFGYPAHRSAVVDPDASGSLNYYMDEDENFYVPKRKVSDFIEIK